ncbi:helix-turn-helix transcriptional regulator, partial [Kitasatospora cinereorecta]
PEVGRTPGAGDRALLVRAEASAATGHDAAAQRPFARALAVAQPDRLRRAFVEAGPWPAAYLRSRPGLGGPYGWLPAEFRPPQGPAGGAEPPPVEPLSEREQEVLRRVAELMSTVEVAADLHLSVNTVKTHLKSINRKLCTTRRADAVRRARRLRLL